MSKAHLRHHDTIFRRIEWSTVREEERGYIVLRNLDVGSNGVVEILLVSRFYGSTVLQR